MAVDPALLQQATWAREHFVAAQHEADRAQVSYQHAIRGLHASGASLGAIADALGLSYQRVHQMVDPTSGKGALKDAAAGAMCAFCGREDVEVRPLIAGPGLFICQRRVDLAADVLAEGQDRWKDGRTTLASVHRANATARCGFCGKRRVVSKGWSRRGRVRRSARALSGGAPASGSGTPAWRCVWRSSRSEASDLSARNDVGEQA
jgi:hypothetical protein